MKRPHHINVVGRFVCILIPPHRYQDLPCGAERLPPQSAIGGIKTVFGAEGAIMRAVGGATWRIDGAVVVHPVATL